MNFSMIGCISHEIFGWQTSPLESNKTMGIRYFLYNKSIILEIAVCFNYFPPVYPFSSIVSQK
ncbi:hypothetical protein CU027_1304 [Enterococcus faecium]|nr:hypothetical protein [Enterococcus faecium]